MNLTVQDRYIAFIYHITDLYHYSPLLLLNVTLLTVVKKWSVTGKDAQELNEMSVTAR